MVEWRKAQPTLRWKFEVHKEKIQRVDEGWPIKEGTPNREECGVQDSTEGALKCKC